MAMAEDTRVRTKDIRAANLTLRHDSLYTYLQWTVRRFWAVSGP